MSRLQLPPLVSYPPRVQTGLQAIQGLGRGGLQPELQPSQQYPPQGYPTQKYAPQRYPPQTMPGYASSSPFEEGGGFIAGGGY